jgi:hypothetical protein
MFFTAKTQRAPRLGIAELADSATRGTGVSPVFLSLDLASRLRERPGAGADGGYLFYRKDAKLAVWRWNFHGW